MSKYIVVGNDGETWFDLCDCQIYRVTPKQRELLDDGDYPKWLGRCKRVDGADISIDKLNLSWGMSGREEE